MAEQNAQNTEKRLSVVKIYVKDFSFESPMSPEVFNKQEWSPNTNLNLRELSSALIRQTSGLQLWWLGHTGSPRTSVPLYNTV